MTESAQDNGPVASFEKPSICEHPELKKKCSSCRVKKSCVNSKAIYGSIWTCRERNPLCEDCFKMTHRSICLKCYELVTLNDDRIKLNGGYVHEKCFTK